MFPIDPAKLPSLKTRRGLMIVDPQNDFLAKDGALPVKTPEDLLQRIVELVTAFRQCGGEIIWVHSQFGAPRSVQSEQILTSDGLMLTGSSKGRRPRAPQQGIEVSKCPEAFLGPEASTRPRCVRQGSSGIEMHPVVQQAVQPKDHVVVKSYYSAFKSEQLLRLLRRRLVTELFICGSLTNIGVMATAVDAASHGYCIAIVEDCCGYRSSMRHHNAIQSISDATGCDVLTREGTLEVFQPKSRFSRRSSHRSSTADGKSSTVRRRTGEEDGKSLTSKLESSFEKLSLNSDPAADDESQHETHAKRSKPRTRPLVGVNKGSKEREIQGDPADTPVVQSDLVDSTAQQHSLSDESEGDDRSAASRGSAKRNQENLDEKGRSSSSTTPKPIS